MHKKNRTSKGFSLIEVAVVIVVIGILIAGIALSSNLISKSRLQMALSLSKSSPIVGITQNVLWLETSLSESIKDAEASDNVPITAWNDQNNSGNRVSVVAVGSGPVYANTINRVHAVKFAGSTANYLQIVDASFLNNTDYTIVVLEKRMSNSSNNYFIGENPSGTANQALALGYSADASVIHSQGSGTSYNSAVSTYDNSTDKARFFVFTHSATDGNKTYVNGLLASQDATKTAHLSGLSTLAIGKGYTGEIGEVVIFTKALLNSERVAVEDYLAKKWSRDNLRKTTSDGKCISGIVTEKGCSMDCSTSSIAGVSSPATVTDGQSGVTATCGLTGYVGNITIGCSLGNISKSGNCGCDTANGYSLSGGVCVKQCSVSVNGSTTTTVTSGVTQVSCDAGGNYATTPFTFSACNGTAITGSCSCNTGYTGSTCSSCDTANNYQMVSGTCQKSCDVPAGSGTTKTSVLVGSTSTACDSPGYVTGNMIYTCNASGVLNVTTACQRIICSVSGAATVTPDTTTVSGSVIYKFTTVGNYTFTCPASVTAKILIVGGGGAGSNYASGTGGGGGGGAVFYDPTYSFNTQTYNITIGAGATLGSAIGASSVLKNSSNVALITSIGGGSGGTGYRGVGNNGGSGGGGSEDAGIGGSPISGASPTGTGAFYGFAGGGIATAQSWRGGGGGGGAGGVGTTGLPGGTNGQIPGTGGIGYQSSISGVSTYYAGGGGGGAGSAYSSLGAGGAGGGGNGGKYNTTAPVAGAANTGGGGGGGGGGTGGNGASGGSGIMIIRY